MILKLIKYNNTFAISAFDNNDQCHLLKQVSEEEWLQAFNHYANNYPDNIQPISDRGQSDELYHVYLP